MHLAFAEWRSGKRAPRHGGEASGSNPFSATMRVLIKYKGKEKHSFYLPFSIGDIVTVLDYGNRFATQEKVNEICSFYNGTPLKKCALNSIGYQRCNDTYSNLEWKVVDIGIFTDVESKIIFLSVKLINRDKEEMLIRCSTSYPNDCVKIVRKAKKQYEEYVINAKY